MQSEFQDEDYWLAQWQQKLSGYHAAPARAGLFIEHLFGKHIESTLELGAGSARDSLHLAERGYQCTASDFSTDTIALLRKQLQVPGLQFSADDARRLSFDDGQFDLVFHNGLIVCFDDDADVVEILREQRRVARRAMLILVHNGNNHRLVRQFGELSKEDGLYDIRFFDPRQLGDLIARSGIRYRRLRMLRFGGPADALFDERIKGFRHPFRSLAPWLTPRLYSLQPWALTERLAALLEL